MIGMKEIGRNYFNIDQAVDIPKHKLQVMPGFATSILQYEENIMLVADVAHKILRNDTVLDIMYELYDRKGPTYFHAEAAKTLVGQIVMTRYNNKTYRVDDIDWDKRPSDSFLLHNGNAITYKAYYKQHYDIDVKDENQPLLVSKPKKKDIRRGQTDNIYILPELCTLTGLSDDARADFNIMKDVAVHTRINPDGRVQKLLTFMNKMTSTLDVQKEMNNWQIKFGSSLVNVDGRILPQEKIVQANNSTLQYKQEDADWARDMRGKKLITPVPLKNWLLICTKRDANIAHDLAQVLCQVGPPMGMMMAAPVVLELPNDRNEAYLTTLRENLNPNIQMVMCILPNNKKDRYDAIKKFVCVDHPVPSQMVVARTLMKKQGLMSIATKIAIQLNCKMGGDVWAVEIPLKGTMIVGIDTYHDSSKKGRSCGGVVASMNKECTRYFSSVTFQMNHEELQTGLNVAMTGALKNWYHLHGALPEKVIVYRDGVGDGQLDAVFDNEVVKINDALTAAGGQEYLRAMALVVVKKRINTRFFYKNGPSAVNPPPGTVIDNTVTKAQWYDFFLVSQSVRQGTVGPTHYNVLWDTTGLKPDHMQRLTYKLTHLYYNWQGTIRVPAPCQYAHKLAFLSGQSLHRAFAPPLADKLFFL